MRRTLELLPYRIEQAIGWGALRSARVKSSRASTAPPGAAPPGRRRLFVDLAVISAHDAGTGIQRVVRELARALREEAPARWDVRFVAAGRKKGYHRIAWPDRALDAGAEEMRARPGDIFLGLDYSLDAVRRHRRQLARFRRAGGALWFLVHDLLPLHRPEWFSPNTVTRYRAWLGILAGLADGFLCNSSQTELELRAALAEVYGLVAGYHTQVLPMGSVISGGQADEGARDTDFTRIDRAEPFALMVGTLEPRKGHADIVAAFDALWRGGSTARLVLVGRRGWQVEALCDLIRTHPEHGAKLLWFEDVADAELFRIYDACVGVIIGSYGEGFGLPLIEALGHGKPVLARDLPVFRLHEGKGVRFFPAAASPEELAAMIEQWLCAAHEGVISIVRPTGGWRESALTLLASVDGSS